MEAARPRMVSLHFSCRKILVESRKSNLDLFYNCFQQSKRIVLIKSNTRLKKRFGGVFFCKVQNSAVFSKAVRL